MNIQKAADQLRTLAAMERARMLGKDQIAAIVAVLRDNGATALAECLIGRLPFDDGRERFEMGRLTDE